MRNLTDKRDWNIDVFNDEIVAKWREEAFKAQDDAEVRGAENAIDQRKGI
jgi:hypothetical protein